MSRAVRGRLQPGRDAALVRSLAALVLALAALAPAAGPAAAASITFGEPAAKSAYGQSITFTVPVEHSGPIARLDLQLTFPGALGPFVVTVPFPSGASTATYVLDVSGSGHIVPNTTIEAQWAAYAAIGQPPVLSAKEAVHYADTDHDWKSLKGDVVTVYWYQGDQAFAQRALAIGDKTVKDTSALLGVDNVRPVDFFIYADNDSFRKALGPGTRENVGGEAHADIRTLFALIEPSAINDAWVGIVIPHELVHLVFGDAVDNPFRAPPRWFNEGLAVYLSQGYVPSDQQAVAQAVKDNTLMPLTALTGQFPTNPDLTSLAYSEAVSAVDHLVRTYGKEALLKLVDAYATGPTDDEAFTTAIGKDVAGFQQGWLEELGASPPQPRGPQAAPAGPVPPGWEGQAPGQPTTPPASSPAAPASSPAPAASAPGAPGTAGPGDGASTLALALVGVAVVVVVVVGGLFLARRRSAP
jgi:peptidase MA superfamily protein